MTTITATTTNNELVSLARKGDKAAFSELETRAKRNGPNSRAHHAVEALKTGKGFASYAEFFAAQKQAHKTAKPKAAKPVKSAPSAPAKPATRSSKSTAVSAWAFIAPSGKSLDAGKLADDVSTVAAVAVKSAILNALTK